MSLGRGQLLAGLATAVVAVAVGVGLYVAGSPSEARLVRQDELRLRRLSHITNSVQAYRREHGVLPANLGLVRPTWGADTTRDRDPVTGMPFTYRVVNDSAISLCADFARPSEKEDYSWDVEWSHPAGRHCFIRRITDRAMP